MTYLDVRRVQAGVTTARLEVRRIQATATPSAYLVVRGILASTSPYTVIINDERPDADQVVSFDFVGDPVVQTTWRVISITGGYTPPAFVVTGLSSATLQVPIVGDLTTLVIGVKQGSAVELTRTLVIQPASHYIKRANGALTLGVLRVLTQIVTNKRLTAVPLAAGDVYVSGADVARQVTVTAVSDQPFSVAVEGSADGSTGWTAIGSSVGSTANGADQQVIATRVTAAAYFRVTVTCGSGNSMTRLTVDEQIGN